MNEAVSYTAWLGASAVLGFFLGLFWEFFRILRRAFEHKSWLVALEDLIFFTISTFCYWILCFSFGLGQIRWFSVFGLLCGFMIYFFSLGRLLTAASNAIIAAVRRFVHWLVHRVFLPLCGLLRRILLTLLRPFVKWGRKLRKVFAAFRKKRRKQAFVRSASRGFR